MPARPYSQPKFEPEAHDDPRDWVETAIMMVEDGFTIADTARMLERTYTVVYDALHPSKRARHNRRWPNGTTGSRCTACGELMSYKSNLAEPIHRKCRSAYARRHDNLITKLWLEGKRADEIAAQLGDMTALDVVHRVNNMRMYQGIDLPYRR